MDYLVCPNGIELKEDTPAGIVEGWASTFGNTDLGGDVVMTGAFDAFAADVKAGREPMPKITDSHVEAIGVYEKMEVRKKGLHVGGAPNQDLVSGREAVIRVSATPAIYDSMSIGYRIRKDKKGNRAVRYTDEGTRELMELSVPEVALLAFPMNPKARITRVKSDALKECTSIREFEHVLRDAGFGREQAKAVASNGYPGLQSLRDADGVEATDDEVKQLLEQLRAGALTTQLRRQGVST